MTGWVGYTEKNCSLHLTAKDFRTDQYHKFELRSPDKRQHKIVPMNNSLIKEVPQHSHLGVTLQRSGRWSEQQKKRLYPRQKEELISYTV